jgi:hypothetical protein
VLAGLVTSLGGPEPHMPVHTPHQGTPRPAGHGSAPPAEPVAGRTSPAPQTQLSNQAGPLSLHALVETWEACSGTDLVDATIWPTRADVADGPGVGEQLRVAAVTAAGQVDELERRMRDLEAVDTVRAAWWVETAYSALAAHKGTVWVHSSLDWPQPPRRWW